MPMKLARSTPRKLRALRDLPRDSLTLLMFVADIANDRTLPLPLRFRAASVISPFIEVWTPDDYAKG